MRLRLFDRVRRASRLGTGSSAGRGRGDEPPGRHRLPGPGGRDLWKDGGGRSGRRMPPVGPAASPDTPPFRPFPSAPSGPSAPPASSPRSPAAKLSPSAAPAAALPRRVPPPAPPRREPPAPPPPGGAPPGVGQGDVQVGGARARVRPRLVSPARDRPAAPDERAPGTPARRGGRPGRNRRPAHDGAPGQGGPPALDGRPAPGGHRAQAGQPARGGSPARGGKRGGDAKRPWYETGGTRSRIRPADGLLEAAPRPAHAQPAADGRRHCGSLERILHRQWDVAEPPQRETVRAIDRLAELPGRLKDLLAAGLDGIYVGAGGVPDLDDMRHLRGVPLPSGHATWDVCAGAYGSRKIVVGARPSPTPDVMCHEVGHALDDIDAADRQWQSDSEQFRRLYDQCRPHLVSDFHRQGDGLGRREFFADAFAAIASRQRPALVDMLGGQTRTALNVMLYFNRRYGI